jgi:phage shock protein C
MQMNRRLYRCRENRRLAGVAAGVAEFFDLDPTLVRVLWFLSIFVGGLGVLLYVGLALIVPLEPLPADGGSEPQVDPAADRTAGTAEDHRHRQGSRGSGRVTMFIGIVLILLGSLALIDAMLPGWAHSWRYLWPVFLVAVGGLLVVGAVRRGPTES